MEVTRLRVEAFKSLYELDTPLDHLTVVTGPNGSGKSNFVDSFTFLADAYRYGLEFAVSRAGGYENIAHRRSRRAKRPIAFEIEVKATGQELWSYARMYSRARGTKLNIPRRREFTLRHRFSFRASSQKLIEDFAVVSEAFALLDSHGRILASLAVRDRRVEASLSENVGELRQEIEALFAPFFEEDFEWDSFGMEMEPTELLAANWRYGSALSAATQFLSRASVYQLSPHVSRRSGVTTPNAALGKFGDNLPGAAIALKRASPAAWAEVQQAMRAILPNLTSVDVATTEDRRLALQFRESDVGRPWNSNEVSDGTIQALALLVALFEPRSSILIIEEPENAVHPWILRKIVDIAKGADRQVLFTTHSPVLLDYVDANCIYLMWSHEGKSTLRRFVEIDPDLADDLTSGMIAPFSLYDSGYFPAAVPRGMSSGVGIES